MVWCNIKKDLGFIVDSSMKVLTQGVTDVKKKYIPCYELLRKGLIKLSQWMPKAMIWLQMEYCVHFLLPR